MRKENGTVEDYPRIDSFYLNSSVSGEMLVEGDLLYFNMCCDMEGEYVELEDEKDGSVSSIRVHQAKNSYYYWICPFCGKKARYLYRIGKFRCASCGSLNYRSQQQTKRDCFEEVDAGKVYAYENFGLCLDNVCPADFPYVIPKKPKGMKPSEYDRKLSTFKGYQRRYEEKYKEELVKILLKCQK